MKKGIIIISSLLILVSLGFLVSAMIYDITSYNAELDETTIQIEEGWNLIPLSGYRSETTCDISDSTLRKNAFIYSPTEKRYLKWLNQNDNDVVKRDQNLKYRYISSDGGAFLYSKTKCKIITHVSFSENHKIAEGWNFIVLEPRMIGEKVKKALSTGDCSLVTKVAAWDSTNQKWIFEEGENREKLGEAIISKDQVGLVFAVKYGEECSLFLPSDSDNEIEPPQLE
ncbi:MAG: hypothetical protein AABX30_02080 [Nanoarchaeota archaeon]